MNNSIKSQLAARIFSAVVLPFALFIFRIDADNLDRALIVTDLSVVDSEMSEGAGPWAFGTLLKRFGKDFNDDTVKTWIESYGKASRVNGFDVAARSPQDLLAFWPKKNDGSLDLDKSPFRLLAIVFRPDAQTPQKPAGEGRFVFGAVHPELHEALQFFVILEFGLPLSSTRSQKDWATDIHRLSKIRYGDEFNRELVRLTDSFSFKPKSRSEELIRSLRTNDFHFAFEWELRQFEIQGDALVLIPTEETPDFSFNTKRKQEMMNWIHANEREIESERFFIPREFWAGASLAPDEDFLWFQEEELSDSLKQKFSLRTCNGCHSGATFTRFTHLTHRERGFPSQISEFMTAELPRRRAALLRMLESDVRERSTEDLQRFSH